MTKERVLETYEEMRATRAPMSIAAIAGRLGLHPKTVRTHVQKMEKSGMITSQQAASMRAPHGGQKDPPTMDRILLLKAVAEHWEDHGTGPTYDWLVDELDMSSTSLVSHHVQMCQRREWLSSDGRGRRGAIRLLPEGARLLQAWLDGDLEVAA